MTPLLVCLSVGVIIGIIGTMTIAAMTINELEDKIAKLEAQLVKNGLEDEE